MNLPPNTTQENLLLESNYYISYIKILQQFADDVSRINRDIQKELKIVQQTKENFKGNYVIHIHKEVVKEKEIKQEQDNISTQFIEKGSSGKFQREKLNILVNQKQYIDKENQSQPVFSSQASQEIQLDNVLEENNQDLNLDDKFKNQILDKCSFQQIIYFQQICKQKMISLSFGHLKLNSIFGKYITIQKFHISELTDLINELEDNSLLIDQVQETIIIVMSGTQFSGFTLLNGSIIINVSYVLQLKIQNKFNFKDSDWRRFLMTFISHNWIHEYGHYIVREFYQDWEVSTPNLKQQINKNNEQFKLLGEQDFIQLESGQILEKLLFGKIFNLTDFTLQYTNYFLNIQNWNQNSREIFRNGISTSIRTDNDEPLSQNSRDNISF